MNLLTGKDLKVTYLLGAGASYQSVPIWKQQGKTMIFVAKSVLSNLNTIEFIHLQGDNNLIEFFENLKTFGQKAIEFGSIDIYAKRLYLIGDKETLKKLKHCISVYFDLWENFYFSKFKLPDKSNYIQIDKRYYSLLSILLEKGINGQPVMNENVNFITWNYDLQLENTLDSFLLEKSQDYKSLNTKFNFFGDNEEKQKIVHLNGFRGIFHYDNEIVENAEKRTTLTEKSYLTTLKNNISDYKKLSYNKTIKYAWESDSESVSKAKEILKQTNILTIVGYSFPAFNRLIDSELINSYIHRKDKARIVYQDPNANDEILNILFDKIPKNFKAVLKETNQFYLPDELLNPIKGKRVSGSLIGL